MLSPSGSAPEATPSQVVHALTGLSLPATQAGGIANVPTSQPNRPSQAQTETRETVGSTLANVSRERTPGRQTARTPTSQGSRDDSTVDIIAEARRAMTIPIPTTRATLPPVKPGYIAGDTKIGKRGFLVILG